MADSVPQQDTFGLKKISSSLFSVPIFGFSTKNSLDPDSVRSPTSPLDFKLFANPFSGKPSVSSSQNGYKKKLSCCKVGLCIVNSLVAGDSKQNDQIIHSPKRNNFILSPRAPKTNNVPNSDLEYPRISNSLPKNYTFSPLSQIKPPSLTSSIQDSCLRSNEFCSEDRSILTSSTLRAFNGGSRVDNNSLLMKSTSLPIPIPIVGSLSVREIELSEDYTCIISHGPNPKTTHIFGDCVLDGHVHELANFDDKKKQETESPQVSFCCTCKESLENSGDIYADRDQEIFCTFDQEEIENACDNSFKGSPESSYHEDLILMGMPDV